MPIDDWFYDTHIPNLSELVKQYVLTDYNIFDDGKIYTEKMQTVLTGLQCAVMERLTETDLKRGKRFDCGVNGTKNVQTRMDNVLVLYIFPIAKMY